MVALSQTAGPWLFLLLSILILIVMGSILEGAAALIIFGPLLIPVAGQIGINGLHFGVVLVIAMGIGLFAPPLGLGLYGACLIGGVPIEATVRPMLGYLGLLLLCLLVIAFVPGLTLWLPHRLGYAAPGRVDQGGGRRARDEDPRQIEQQRRVLVAARMKPGQRHQQFAPLQVDVADQVEGGIGRDEAVGAIRGQKMRAAVADRGFDLGQAWRARGWRRGLWARMLELDGIQEVRHRLADRGPVRRHVVARLDQRIAQRL